MKKTAQIIAILMALFVSPAHAGYLGDFWGSVASKFEQPKIEYEPAPAPKPALVPVPAPAEVTKSVTPAKVEAQAVPVPATVMVPKTVSVLKAYGLTMESNESFRAPKGSIFAPKLGQEKEKNLWFLQGADGSGKKTYNSESEIWISINGEILLEDNTRTGNVKVRTGFFLRNVEEVEGNTLVERPKNTYDDCKQGEMGDGPSAVFINAFLDNLKPKADTSVRQLLDFTDGFLGQQIATVLSGGGPGINQETMNRFLDMTGDNDSNEVKIIKALGAIAKLPPDKIGMLIHVAKNSEIDWYAEQYHLIEEGKAPSTGTYVGKQKTPNQLKTEALLDVPASGRIIYEEWSDGNITYNTFGMEIVGAPSITKTYERGTDNPEWFLSVMDSDGNVHAGPAYFLTKTPTYSKLWAEIARQNHHVGLTTKPDSITKLTLAPFKMPGEKSEASHNPSILERDGSSPLN